MLRDLLAEYPPWAAGLISISSILTLSYVAAEITARIARAVLARFAGLAPEQALAQTAISRPVRAARLAIFIIVFLALLFPALKVAGLRTQVGFEPEFVVSWLLESGLRIALIIVLATLMIRATASVVRRIETEVARGESLDARERTRRVKTLGKVVENVVGTFVVASALLMVLRELDVDVFPLLTGAGIVGLAIGFGAQTLVKDVISGFFMILENQVRVGDVAVINGTSGVVEGMMLRTIALRDDEGTVHVFPNGSISTLANKTKDFSYAVLNITVPYKEDPDRVEEVLRQVGAEMQHDGQLQAIILEPLNVFGIEGFSDAGMTIKIRFKTPPLRQWDVAREMRRRIKRAFDISGIELSGTTRTLVVVGATGGPAASPLDATRDAGRGLR